MLADKSPSGGANKNEIMSNKELGEELHKPIIRKFEKRKVNSYFIDNIWDADLANMQLISKFNKGFALLLVKVLQEPSKIKFINVSLQL